MAKSAKDLSARAARCGKVAVVYGGTSPEREVSLMSGARVLEGLLAAGVDAVGLDKDEQFVERLKRCDVERVFLILHGTDGEDGRVQGLLEELGMPYTGSGVLASALAMDKRRTKLLWRGLGLPTPDFGVAADAAERDVLVQRMGFPLFVKPVGQGSSVGASPAHNADAMDSAWQTARQFGDTVLLERFVNGAEYTVAILKGRALPVIRLEPARTFYDYEAKYADGAETRYHIPCGLSAAKEEEIKQLALAAFDALGAKDWGRIDLMLDRELNPWLLELNTAPGMTSHSLVPMAAQAIDIGFEELVLEILEGTL